MLLVQRRIQVVSDVKDTIILKQFTTVMEATRKLGKLCLMSKIQ